MTSYRIYETEDYIKVQYAEFDVVEQGKVRLIAGAHEALDAAIVIHIGLDELEHVVRLLKRQNRSYED